MAVKFKDFMLNWYKAYHLYNMDDPRKQRWADLRGKSYEINSKGEYVYLDDARNSVQKGWANPKTGELATELPLPDLSEEDWEYFYRLCRTAIRNINDKREDLLRNDPDKNPLPIDKWFGSKNLKAFSVQEVKQPIKDKLKQFAAVVMETPRLKNKLMDSFSADYSIDTFLADLIDQDYSRNSQFTIAKIQTLVRILPGLLRPEYDFKVGDYKNPFDDKTNDAIQRIFIGTGYDPMAGIAMDDLENQFDEISAELDPANEQINPMQLAQFKHPSVYKEILKALYAPDKPEKKSPFHSQFASNGGGEITGYMNEVVGGNNYESGANELVPKLGKELNIREQFNKKIGDFQDEHFLRLTDRAARHVYIEPAAKGIVDAIIKEKISPTDGLNKIIEKKDAVVKRVQAKSPVSKKGCDFFFEALSYIQASGDMDEALSGALKNGRKAEAIAFEIIKYAISKRKINEAKAALEVFAVMRYDTFSSAHWNDLKKSQNDIFGDKNLSFNKNETMSFLTRALDKTIWLGVNGAFWTGVLTRNLIQHGRGKMSPDDMVRMESALTKINSDSQEFTNLADAQAQHSEIRTQLLAARENFGYAMILRDEYGELNNEITRLESEVPAATKDTDLSRLTALQKEIAVKKDARDKMHSKLTAYADEFAKLDELQHKINGLNHEIAALGDALRTETDEVRIDAIRHELETKSKQLKLYSGCLNVYDKMRQDYMELEREDRVAQELATRLGAAADRGHAKETESKPYNAPKSDIQNMQMLMAFWNAANGYTRGINVNSYNIFRNIKNVRKNANLQKTFNQMVNYEYE